MLILVDGTTRTYNVMIVIDQFKIGAKRQYPKLVYVLYRISVFDITNMIYSCYNYKNYIFEIIKYLTVYDPVQNE